MEGEEIQLHKVTRSEMGAYMCIATNGVPPAVGKTVQLNVNCKRRMVWRLGCKC